MVAHRLVDIEVGGRRRIEAGEQLVDDDEQLHLAGLVDELLLHLALELVDAAHRVVLGLVEPGGEHLAVDVILPQLLGQAFAGLLALDAGRRWLVRRDDGTAIEPGGDEELVELAGVVDAIGDQQRVAVTALEPVARLHIEHDVLDDPLQARFGAEHALQGAPALLELGERHGIEALRLDLEPLVHLGLRGEPLVDIARLIAQVEHDAIADGLVVFVGVDVGAEDLEAGLLVILEERRAGEANEGGLGQDLLHRAVELARLRAVALVDVDDDLAPGVEPGGRLRFTSSM